MASSAAPGSGHNIRDLPADMFASEVQHSQYRGISHLVKIADQLVAREPGSLLMDLTKDQGKFRARYNFQQVVDMNLLVRNHEVIAGVLTSLVPNRIPEPNDPDAFTTIVQPRIVIAANPRENEIGVKAHDRKTMVVEDVDRPALDVSAGVIETLLRKYSAGTGFVYFETHVGWFVGLLKACHTPNLSDADYEKNVKALRTYVHFSSSHKALRRKDIGMAKGSNIFKILTAGVQQFKAGIFDVDDIPSNLKDIRPTTVQQNYLFILLNSLSVDESEIQEACSKPLYDIAGRVRFHCLLGTLVKHLAESLDAYGRKWRELDDTKSPTRWTINPADVKEVEELVHLVEDDMIRLNNFIGLFSREPFQPASTSNSDAPDLLRRHLTWLGQQARVQSRLDVPFMAQQAEKEEEEEHAARGAQNTPAPSTPLVPSSSPIAALPLPQQITQGPIDPSSSSSSDSDDDENYDDVTLAYDYADYAPEDLDPDEEDDGLTQLSEGFGQLTVGVSLWAASSLKYLELMCLPEHGLSEVCPRVRPQDRTKSQYIHLAKVTVVDIRIQEKETKRMSLKNVLDIVLKDAPPGLNRNELESRLAKTHVDSYYNKKASDTAKAEDAESEVSPAKLQEVLSAKSKEADARSLSASELERRDKTRAKKELGKVKENYLTDTAHFGGTMHCETILMAAIALLKQPGIETMMLDHEWLKRNGLFEIKAMLLTLLKTPAPLLTVSKCCCPSCWEVFTAMMEDKIIRPKKVKIARPGHHTKWFAVQLPAFLLKKYVSACIEAGIKAALEKLVKLQAILNEEAAARSKSSSPASNQGVSDEQSIESFRELRAVTNRTGSKNRIWPAMKSDTAMGPPATPHVAGPSPSRVRKHDSPDLSGAELSKKTKPDGSDKDADDSAMADQ